MAKFNCVVFLGAIAAAIGLVSAITEEEKNAIRAVAIPALTECGKQLNYLPTKISKEEVLAAMESHDLDTRNPCLYACFLKKTGVMNDQGLFDPVAAKAAHKKYIHGQEELNELDSITDTCSAVNDQSVSDGAQGCDRAKLLARCFADNKGSFHFLFE